MTTTPTINPDAIEQDAERRLVELNEQAERLAPEALADAKVAQELRDVESERQAGVASRTHSVGRPYDGAVRFAFGAAGVDTALEPPLGGGPLGPRPIEKQDTNDKENT